jgi:hypothetical protein
LTLLFGLSLGVLILSYILSFLFFFYPWFDIRQAIAMLAMHNYDPMKAAAQPPVTGCPDLTLIEEYDLENFADHCYPYGLDFRFTDGGECLVDESPGVVPQPMHLHIHQQGALEYPFTFTSPNQGPSYTTSSPGGQGGQVYDTGYGVQPQHSGSVLYADPIQVSSLVYPGGSDASPAPSESANFLSDVRQELPVDVPAQPQLRADYYTPSPEASSYPPTYTDDAHSPAAFTYQSVYLPPVSNQAHLNSPLATLSHGATDYAVPHFLTSPASETTLPLFEHRLSYSNSTTDGMLDQGHGAPVGLPAFAGLAVSQERSAETPLETTTIPVAGAPSLPEPVPVSENVHVAATTSSLELTPDVTPNDAGLPVEEELTCVKRAYTKKSKYWEFKKKGLN